MGGGMSSGAVRRHHLHGPGECEGGAGPRHELPHQQGVEVGKGRGGVVQKPVKVEPRVGTWWMTSLTSRGWEQRQITKQ